MRRNLAIAGAAFGSFASLILAYNYPASAGSDRKAAEGELRIATSRFWGFTATFAAHGDDHAGRFNFKVLSFAEASSQGVAALNAGEADVVELGEVGPVVAQAAGIPFKVIAATESWGLGEAIIVKRASPIHTLADLKGKRVAYGRATNGHATIIKALATVGLRLDDIQSTFLPPGTNIEAALDSDIIDAAVTIDTPLSAYEASGARRLASAADVGESNVLFYIASDEALKNKRDSLAAFVKQLANHIAWSHAKPEERGAIIANLLTIEPSVAIASEKRRPARLQPIGESLWKSNQEIANSFQALGVISTKLDTSTTFTTEFNDDITPD